MLEFVLILNVVWFAAGFHLFYLRGKVFAKVVVPKEQRDTPVFDVLIQSGKFLGGFNLAFATLNVLLLMNQSEFDTETQWTILLFVNAVAHGTQFAFNVPIAIQNRQGTGVWQVFKGLMFFIFVTDFSLMAFNGILAAIYLL